MKETKHAWIVTESQHVHVRVWGITPAERLRRTLCAAEIANDHISIGPTLEAVPVSGSLLLFRSDYVFDERLVRALVTSTDTVLVTPSTTNDSEKTVAAHVTAPHVATATALLNSRSFAREDAAELHLVRPTDLVPAYTATLRKTDPPYVFAVQPENLAEIEARIFAASYKGITDLVTKWVWPRPARVVTRWCANTGITPNAITFLSWVLVVLVTWLFLRGDFGLGLILAWLMTFLDTVDGKLARVTLTSSRIGHVLDHGLDILHPPFWYLAWSMGLLLSPDGGALSADSNVAAWLRPAGLITVVGYIVGRLIEGLFMLLFKMEIHCWQPIDAFFRTITARRNPNLLLLSAATLVGRPDVGLVLVALWTLLSIVFHTVRVLQALAQRLRGQSIAAVWQDTSGSPALATEAMGKLQRQPESAA
ncbi:MAG: CDP-alcohol phosphatidyltransferase family protein [Deltaproteobacteria bacterium]|nr:CDP-alcohol phosphatidyltransferase family protein [Deltaproteobacteria bacterium]